LSEEPTKTGYVVSGVLHAGLLAAVIFGFASAPKFEDASESIPVDTITQSEFNEIMKGERDAPPAKVQPPATPQETLAYAAPEALPPSPPPRPSDEPKPPPKPAQETPQPSPPPRPAQDTPSPIPSPKPKPTPSPSPTPKTDALAKLIDEPKSDTPKPTRAMDPNAIRKLLADAKPTDPAQPAAQGLPNHSAPRMSPSLAAALDAWFTEAYLNCWNPPPTVPAGEKYVAQIKVVFAPDGSLSAQPVLINPPSDPAWQAHAESAMRAVLKCNPLHVPPQYAPYFEQWRTKTVHFDPESALG